MQDYKQNNENGDLDLSTGDLQIIEDATNQHQKDLILTNKGELKNNGGTGVGVETFLNDESPENLFHETKKQFIRDGMQVRQIGIINGKFAINANY